jgi:hypothetical protein
MKLYISSYEYETFEKSREILSFQNMIIENRNILVVKVDTPIIGQKYGLGGIDIQTVYLLPRFIEDPFNKLDIFPIDVCVLIPISVKNLVPKSLSDLQNIAWACLYNNKKDAKNHKIK